MSNYTRNTLTGDLAPINAELEKVQNAIADKLDRSPAAAQANQLKDVLDANSNRIINLPAPSSPNDAARLVDVAAQSGTSVLPPQSGQNNRYLKTDGTTPFWSNVTKAEVGLGNVDNTTDALKPISTPQQTALNLKVNLEGITTTGLISSTTTYSANTSINTIGFTTSGGGGAGSWVQNGVTGQTVSQSPAQLGLPLLNDGNGNQWAMSLTNTESFETFNLLQASTSGNIGQKLICRERADAAYILQPTGYAALAGDATLANGIVAKLQINADINIANFANLAESLQRDYKLGSTYTINIPTDAATLQDAVLMSGSIEGFNEYSNIILNIESGHAPASGIILNGQDLSKFTVTSTDAVVTVSSSWSATSSFILALNSIAPTLGCVVNMNLKGEKGYHLDEASKGRVLASCGVNNAGGLTSGEGTGLFLSGASQCSAKSSVFNGSYRNIWAAHESICYADFANADGATGDAGVYCARGSHVGISYGSASNCAGNGVRCRRAFLLCMQVTATGNGTGGAGYGVLVTEGGTVIASQGDGSTIDGADLSNNKQGAINCDASTVIARESDLRAGALTGSANSVIATSGSTVNVELSDLRGLVGTNYVSGILARQSTVIAMTAKFDYNTSSAISSFSSTIDCAAATIDRSQRGINAQKLSRINASNAVITNSTVHGVLSQGGSIVSVDDGSVTSSSTTDLRIEEGGQIVGHNCTTTGGGTPTVANTNVAALNAIYSTGIIWG